jgi:hypothetical protein
MRILGVLDDPAGWFAGNSRAALDVVGNDCARTNEGGFANGHPAEDHGARS